MQYISIAWGNNDVCMSEKYHRSINSARTYADKLLMDENILSVDIFMKSEWDNENVVFQETYSKN